MNNLNKSLMFVAIVLVVITGINLFNNLNLTGKVTDTGDVNLTVESAADISFNVSQLNWGTGYVDEDATHAFLVSNGTVYNGTGFETLTQGLTIQNDGNVNITLNLSSNVAAAGLFDGTSPAFKWRLQLNETGACAIATNITDFEDVTTSESWGCLNMGYDNSQDLLDLDIYLLIPADTTPESKGAVITAEGTAIS